MAWTQTTTRTIDLGYEQLLTFVGRPGTKVRVLFGSMWLTEEGNEQDVFVCCGDEVMLQSGGLSVIEGLGAARVQLIEPVPQLLAASVLERARRLWHGLRRRIPLRDLVARSVIFALAVAVSMSLLHLAAPGPLSFDDFAAQGAPRAKQAADALLHDVASARTGFLTVN